ncbi:hypothetical protein KM176_03165 [Pseudooceanicola sp. CBS1P-1]|uniref:Uncharacterized protein n=1 Tax=Pseudooceanicola albus TaxID=2692189 RepID=A0A6L7G857_9RHOB|nr:MULTISPECIES: hypothetical protein [Pseudooceanicola]MBT9382851.1 hypothetical protein [Pseudooceanicola endophyticus]MXN20225.1 hypothetical protein [Pseudooceanicola albus]
MPLELTEDRAVLHGHAEITEAEDLLAWLRRTPAPRVDVSGCGSAHLAVLQVLLALRPALDGIGNAQDWRGFLAAARPQETE